jgi:stage II sporulation protein D
VRRLLPRLRLARRPRLLAATLLATCLAHAGPLRAEEIKIEVSRTTAKAQVSGEGLEATQGSNGASVQLSGAKVHALAALAGRLLLDGREVRAPLVLRPGKGPIGVEGRALPGRVEVWAEQGRLVIVNALELEEYVAAVVSSEVPSQWPAAALQAQAVAARTYAVAQKIQLGAGARAHLGSSVLDQVYKGAAHPQGSAKAAAEATFGEVLTWESAPIEAWFSASCGGMSESAEAAFNTPAGLTPYAKAQGDGDADEGYRLLAWTVRLPLWKLTSLLRKAKRAGGAVESIAIAETTASGRARSVRLALEGGGQLTMSGAELRQVVGYTQLPSLLFTVRVEEKGGKVAVFTGKGSGHGVGLCQWGARGRAAKGESYREILSHYYPGAEVRRMY